MSLNVSNSWYSVTCAAGLRQIGSICRRTSTLCDVNVMLPTGSHSRCADKSRALIRKACKCASRAALTLNSTRGSQTPLPANFNWDMWYTWSVSVCKPNTAICFPEVLLVKSVQCLQNCRSVAASDRQECPSCLCFYVCSYSAQFNIHTAIW